MIKLIASDIDGTLLPEGTNRVNEELFEIIRELKNYGIMFAAASGRQYESMRHVFEPVANDIIFIAENGSNVMCRGYAISSVCMEDQMVRELIGDIKALPGCCPLLSTTSCMYVENKDVDLMDLMVNVYHNHVQGVEDMLEKVEHVNKVSLYCPDGVKQVAPSIIQKWEGKIRGMVAGKLWIDFMDDKADKGHAIKTIQKQMGILPEETMVFGDNHNDLGMLRSAGESYAVANAQKDVRDQAKYIADTNENDGVLKVLKRLLEELSGEA